MNRGPGAGRLAGTIGLLLALALVALTPAYAAGSDIYYPDGFEGTATINGQPVAPGTVVEAWVTGETQRRAWTSLFEFQGQSWYVFTVPRIAGDPGRVVTFKVGGELANETHTFGADIDAGRLYKINLTLEGEPVIVEYDLTIGSTAGGSVTTPAEGTSPREAGKVVNLVAVADEGYEFKEWTTADGEFNANFDNRMAATTTFAMPESDVTITAHFEEEEEEPVYWTLTMAASPPLGGTITPAPTQYLREEGQLVNITASPASGYQFAGWQASTAVNFGNAAATTTSFNMPSSDVVITAQFSLAPAVPDPFLPVGCFIATAAYGTDSAVQIDILREFRDTVLLPNRLGAGFVSLYYRTSPPIAGFISGHDFLRTAVRVGMVDPIVALVNWSHGVWSGGS